jgi:TetR/AcrR family transcriptional repressor of nem operon
MDEKPFDPRKRPKDFDASRSDFLRAAFEVFAEKGYHQASVDEIVKKASRSKGGFYHHFRSKEEVYIELFGQIIQGVGDEILRQVRSGKHIRELLMGLIDFYEPRMNDSQKMVAATDFFHLAIRNEEVKKIVLHLHKQSVKIGTSMFEEAARRGEFRTVSDIEALTDMIFTAGRGLMIMSVVLDGGKNFASRLRVFVDQQLRALEIEESRGAR